MPRGKELTPLHVACEKDALRLERAKGDVTQQDEGGGEGEPEAWRVETRRMYGVSEAEVVEGLLQGVVHLLLTARELEGVASR